MEVAEFQNAVSALVGPFVESGEIPVLEPVGSGYLVHLIRMVGASGELSKRLWFERHELRLVREEIFEPGAGSESATVIEFFDYRPWPVPAGPEIDWPDRVVVTQPGTGGRKEVRLEIEFREIHINTAISPEEYRIP